MDTQLDESAKETAKAWIDAHMTELSAWHTKIWEFAEPAWREYRSARWYVGLLRDYGFDVEEGSAGMPTAFSASWSNGPGPQLLTYAEYDAVPGNSQAALTVEQPRDSTNRFAPGHTDPHSALGISTLAGLLATQHAMRIHDIQGTLRYTGEPAEKMHGSKVVHGLHGYYDDLDAIISFHPFYMLPLCNTARWDTQCGAYYSKVYTFVCDAPETWQLSANPQFAHPGIALRRSGTGRKQRAHAHVLGIPDHARRHASQRWRMESQRRHPERRAGHRRQSAGASRAHPVLLAHP